MEGGGRGDGGGGLGTVVSVITSAASNWVSRHTAPLSVRSHRLHVLQCAFSPSPCLPSCLPHPHLRTIHGPLVLVHRVSRAWGNARSTLLSPSPLSLLSPLVGRNLPRDSPSGPRGRSDLGFATRLLRKISVFPRATENSCPLVSAGKPADIHFSDACYTLREEAAAEKCSRFPRYAHLNSPKVERDFCDHSR